MPTDATRKEWLSNRGAGAVALAVARKRHGARLAALRAEFLRLARSAGRRMAEAGVETVPVTALAIAVRPCLVLDASEGRQVGARSARWILWESGRAAGQVLRLPRWGVEDGRLTALGCSVLTQWRNGRRQRKAETVLSDIRAELSARHATEQAVLARLPRGSTVQAALRLWPDCAKAIREAVRHG